MWIVCDILEWYGVGGVVYVYFFFVPLHIFFCRQYIFTVNFPVNALKRSIFYCTTIFSR